MKALTFQGEGDVKVREVPKPSVAASTDALIKVTFGHGEYFGGLGGGQAEFVVVPNADHTMEAIPEGMRDDQAIFVGDILATGFFGAERAEIKPGDVVA